MQSDSESEVWLSLVERFVRDEEAAGSNPVTSTIKKGRRYMPATFFAFFNMKCSMNRLFEQDRTRRLLTF